MRQLALVAIGGVFLLAQSSLAQSLPASAATSAQSAPGTGANVTCRTPAATPGELYVEKGICPGECCTYREWTATSDVPVVKAPGATKVVATLSAGEKIIAETGEVHVAPLRACTVRTHALESVARRSKGPTTLKPGDVFWVLSPVGEGFATFWVKGKLYTEPMWFAFETSLCAEKPDSEECWAKVDAPPDAMERWTAHRWWVRIRTSKGVRGWVDNSKDVLTGFDACAVR